MQQTAGWSFLEIKLLVMFVQQRDSLNLSPGFSRLRLPQTIKQMAEHTFALASKLR